jgi:hypothetical protein
MTTSYSTTADGRDSGAIPMPPLREALTGDLAWRRPTWLSRSIELVSDTRVLARLDYHGVLRSGAIGRTAEGTWTLAREGFFRYPFVVREAASGQEVARFERQWIGRGTLRFASGAEYKWSSRGAFRPTWFWAVPNGDDLMRYRTVFDWTRRIAFEVEPTALRLAELPVLALTGAHLMIMIHRARAH